MIKKIKNIFPTRNDISAHRRPLLLCLASGLFGALLFHQNWLGLLGWIALIPLFIAIHSLRGKMLAWGTMLFGFTWYYLGTFWLHTLIVFHWLIPLGVVVGAAYMAAYFLLFTFPAAWCCRHMRPAARPWAIAVCWTAVEYLRNFTEMAFPWNLLGHSQAPVNTIHMALAAVGGVYLISFLMALINASIATALAQWRAARNNEIDHIQPPDNIRTIPRNSIRHALTIPIFFVFLITLFWGIFPPSRSDLNHPTQLAVSIIQPGTSQLKKWDAYNGVPGDTAESAQRRFRETDIQMQEQMESLIREAARQDDPQLVLLPESVFLSGFFPYETTLHDQLTSLSRQINADLFFGADNRIDRKIYNELTAEGQRFLRPGDVVTTMPLPTLPMIATPDGMRPDLRRESPVAATVAAWHVSVEDGLDARVYNKMQLVPFGETVPFISGFAWLRNKLELAGIAGAFYPGMQNTIFEVDGAKFGAVICFESTFSHLTRHLAQAGAQFICVLTNDGWYDPEYAISEGGFWGTLFRIPGIKQLAAAGPGQHLVQSRFRAIETGLPVVRSANSGISAIIDGGGRIMERLPYSESGFLSGSILVHDEAKPTFAVRYGEWVGLICTGLWAAVFVGMGIGRLRYRLGLH